METEKALMPGALTIKDYVRFRKDRKPKMLVALGTWISRKWGKIL